MSPTILERLRSSAKERKALPLILKDEPETEELETLVATHKALRHLIAKINQFDVSKGKSELKEAACTVANRTTEYEAMRLTRDCDPRPAMVSKPETTKSSTDMTLTPEWWVPEYDRPKTEEARGRQEAETGQTVKRQCENRHLGPRQARAPQLCQRRIPTTPPPGDAGRQGNS